jgi:hypothetical protein
MKFLILKRRKLTSKKATRSKSMVARLFQNPLKDQTIPFDGVDNMKILTESDLNEFLKELSHQSVREAYEAERLMEAPEDEEEEDDIFGGDDEEESPGGDEGGEPAEEDPFGGDDEEEEPEEPPELGSDSEEEREKVEIRPTPMTLELGQISSDGLIATLNMIRAGRSFKEADVATELRKYFEEQLDDAERLALATFLSGIRDITSGQTAEDATDPGDENVSISAREDGEGITKAQPQQRVAQDDANIRTAPPSPVVRSGGMEDTSAPVRVGQRNESKFREYVLELLNRNAK